MVAISKSAVLHGLDDARVKVVTLDNSSSITYGTLYEVKNVQEMALNPKINNQELRAKGQIVSIWSRIESVPFTFSNATMDLEVLAAITGSTAPAAAGSTPAQTQTLNVAANVNLPYFRFEGKVNYAETAGADVGDAHVVLYKAKLSEYKFTLSQDGFAIVSGGGTAVATVNTGFVFSIIFNETAKAST